jgi:hypothetical protein
MKLVRSRLMSPRQDKELRQANEPASGKFGGGQLVRRSGFLAAAVGVFFTTLTMARQPNLATADIRASFRFDGTARRCADLITPCLSLSQQQRSSCLFEVALDSHCEGSELGRLAFRRWANEASGEGDVDVTDVTAQTTDDESSCIDKFDARFEERLRSGHLSSSEIVQLSGSLEGCRMAPQKPELLRP